MTRRLTVLFLIGAMLLLSLTACGGENYELRKSTEKEAATVLTMEGAEIPFEMLYTFFRSECERINGFDDAYFTGDGGEARFTAVLDRAKLALAEVYALFAVCREVGIDPASKAVEDDLLAYLKINVEGGYMGDELVEGLGSYDAYLAYIKEAYHMNDSVNRTMLRYALCEDLLVEYYRTKYRYSAEDVRAFFMSDDCVRTIWVGRNYDSLGLNKEGNYDRILTARTKLMEGKHVDAIALSDPPVSPFFMGHYTKDRAYYGDLIDATYALADGRTSEVYDLGIKGYYVVKRLPKDSTDFEYYYEEIEDVYLFEELYRRVEEKKVTFAASAIPTEVYKNLTVGDFT